MGFLIGNRSDGGDDVLKLGDLPQGTPGGHPVVLRHLQDEIALVSLELGEKARARS